MKNKSIWLGIQVIVLVFGMMVIGCAASPEDNHEEPYVPPVKDPLTGTVTITSDVDIYLGKERMTLTANLSDLNVGAIGNSYQWKRNDVVNISGANKSTYEVTSDDIGKKISVHVTNSEFSGEKSGEYTVPVPTTLNLTLKWDSNAGKKDTGIIIEKENESYWASTSGNLTTTGTTITLTSWIETKFKMRTVYTMIEYKYYFKKDNAEGSELFDFANGSKTFVLTNTLQQSIVFYDLFATEE